MNDLSPESRFLHDLVAIPSVSGNEGPAAQHFADFAASLGFDSEVDEAGNALAARGPGLSQAHTHIVLLGHIDTVSGDIPVRIEQGVLHGRGSVDAKGPLCAMLWGAHRATLPKCVRVTVCAAVGEETAGSPGARALVTRFTPDA